MAITVTAGGLRLTTQPKNPLPNVVKTALAAPGCVVISATGSGRGGAPLIELGAVGTRKAFWGYSFFPSVAAGQQAPLAHGCIVDGFAGVTQGDSVYFADDGSLTHTQPAATPPPIGVGVTASKIYFYPCSGQK